MTQPRPFSGRDLYFLFIFKRIDFYFNQIQKSFGLGLFRHEFAKYSVGRFRGLIEIRLKHQVLVHNFQNASVVDHSIPN